MDWQTKEYIDEKFEEIMETLRAMKCYQEPAEEEFEESDEEELENADQDALITS